MKFVCMKVEYAQLTRSVVAFKDIWKNKKLSLMIASYIVDVVLFKILSKWEIRLCAIFPRCWFISYSKSMCTWHFRFCLYNKALYFQCTNINFLQSFISFVYLYNKIFIELGTSIMKEWTVIATVCGSRTSVKSDRLADQYLAMRTQHRVLCIRKY